ncbi:MAG: hypothetical protein AAGC59_15230, partial [Brucella pseudogrignonensis]
LKIRRLLGLRVQVPPTAPPILLDKTLQFYSSLSFQACLRSQSHVAMRKYCYECRKLTDERLR